MARNTLSVIMFLIRWWGSPIPKAKSQHIFNINSIFTFGLDVNNFLGLFARSLCHSYSNSLWCQIRNWWAKFFILNPETNLKKSCSLIFVSWWTGGRAAPVSLANIFEVSILIYLKQGYKYLWSEDENIFEVRVQIYHYKKAEGVDQTQLRW